MLTCVNAGKTRVGYNSDDMEELIVIQKAKELGEYIFLITNHSPKKFRFTFVSRIQNLMLDVIENLYRANRSRIVKGDMKGWEKRRYYQREADTALDLLCYIAMLARTQQCILPKQYQQIAEKATELKRLIYGWARSDQRRS